MDARAEVRLHDTGRLLADYFRGDAIRFFVLAIAFVFAIPFLVLQLGASGFLISVVTDGAVSRDMAMWGLAPVLLAYVTAGGLRAVAYVASLQCILLAAGMIIVGLIALDLALAFQLWPSLLAATWFPWITRQGAVYGLAAGMIAVVFTEGIGQILTGDNLPWGRWPWTIHSAGWGMAANLLVCIVGSAMIQDERERAHRMRYHEFLRTHAAPAPGRPHLKTFAVVVVLVWMFFAVGPGAVVGNYIFGSPGAGLSGWDFGMPSLWVWQILWWALGVVMLWLLAYKLDFSTAPAQPVPRFEGEHRI